MFMKSSAGVSLLEDRKNHGKSGTFPFFALHLDVAPMLLHNAISHGKTQPGSPAYLLGGVEGFSTDRTLNRKARMILRRILKVAFFIIAGRRIRFGGLSALISKY